MANAGADFGAVFDAHVKAEFVDLDVDAAMATMTPNPHLTHLPADTVTEEVSRTIGEDRLVDEMILRFTHDIEMDGILPGVGPTGRFVEMALAVVVDFEDGKVSAERIYWDQASVLVQLGLLDPTGLPVTGAAQAQAVKDPTRPRNQLLGENVE